MAQSILQQVLELERMDIGALKERWKSLFDTEPPAQNRPHMVKRLAYRIQELAYGGLPEEAKARLTEIALTQEQESKRPRRNGPVVGTRFVREWGGERHEVTVTRDGYEYRGRPFKSLSAIARAITGTRWNGRLFFGLCRQEEGA